MRLSQAEQRAHVGEHDADWHTGCAGVGLLARVDLRYVAEHRCLGILLAAYEVEKCRNTDHKSALRAEVEVSNHPAKNAMQDATIFP